MISDAVTATEMTSARSANSCPDTSFRNMIGRKMTTVVAVDASSAPHTWLLPSVAACSASTPFSRRRTMFSSTTMAASSTMPVANASPASEIMFSVRPVICITTKPTNSETGIAIATMNVARSRRRNHHRIATASAIPSSRLVRSIAIESSM